MSDIFELEAQLREATLANDLVATDALLADDWLNINANGTLTTKAQLLNVLQTLPFKFLSIEDKDVQMRLFGDDIAIVTGISTRVRVGDAGQPLSQTVRFTRVWIALPESQSNLWQVVAAQATPVDL